MTGVQTCALPISDMALWLLVMLVRGKTGQIYNLGSDVGVTVEAVARIVAAQSQPRLEVLLNASHSRSIPTSILIPDTSAAARDFGLKVITDLDTAIQHALKWHQTK